MTDPEKRSPESIDGEPRRRNRDGAPRAGVTARYVGLVAAVLLFAVPVYIYVEPPWRALVARLAAAAVLGVVLLELRSVLARRTGRGGSELDDARRRNAPEPGVPEPFLALMDDVRAAAWSRRYFDEVFWPRLTAFTPAPLARPAARSIGRGPSLASLRKVIIAIGSQTEAGAPPSEAAIVAGGAAGRRGAGAPPSEATTQ